VDRGGRESQRQHARAEETLGAKETVRPDAGVNPSTLELFDSFAMIGRSGHRDVQSLPDAAAFTAEMDRHGIARSLVHHFVAREMDPLEGNELAIKACRGSDRLVPCAVLYPSATNEFGDPEAYVERMVSDGGVRAFRFCPFEGRYRFRPFVVGDWCEILAARGIPALVDFGLQQHFWHHMPDYESVHAICTAFPRLNVVIGHIGVESNRMLYATMRACPNLHCDASTLIAGFIEDAVGRFGTERVLLGTRMPMFDPAGQVGILRHSRLDGEALRLVAAGNLRRLIGGKPR
jgi:predicted TIM-barrel fold metal-dependent hydrolase